MNESGCQEITLLQDDVVEVLVPGEGWVDSGLVVCMPD